MRFAATLALAAGVAQAQSITDVLSVVQHPMFTTMAFWQTFLLNLQRDTTNTSSDCMSGFSDLEALYNELQAYIVDDTAYLAGLAEKGLGAGTEFGYMMDKGEKYIDLAISSTNVFNECDIKYYVNAVTLALSNVSGLVNQIVNTVWRSQDTSMYADMQTCVANSDSDACAALLGQFVKEFLQAEIPDKSSATSYQSVGSLM